MSNKNMPYRLSEIESNQGIRFSNAGATPGHHCPMHTALASIRKIEGLSSLVIGMPECSFYSRYVMESPIGDSGELHYTYVLDSNEVVFGCRDGVTSALEEMQHDGAKAIVLIMTCIPALIGEDIMEIAETFSSEHDTKAVCIDLAHYRRNGYEAGFYETYVSLLQVTKDTPHPKKQVSILGMAVGDEANELREWIGSGSYEIKEIGGKFSLEDFAQIKDSMLNIVTHMHYLPLAKKLEEIYQTPFVFMGESYSLNEIKACYERIQTHLQLSQIPNSTYLNHAQILEKAMQEQFKNSKFMINAMIEDVLPLTSYLSSLSMIPCLIHLEEYQLWMKKWKEEILRYEVDPLVTYVVQKKFIKEIVKEAGFLDDDSFRISIGVNSGNGEASILAQRSFLPPVIGYEKTYSLLIKLEQVWKENHYATL